MWYFNGQTIKTPKAMVISDITYPKAIFRDSDTLASLGIKPMRIVTVKTARFLNTNAEILLFIIINLPLRFFFFF